MFQIGDKVRVRCDCTLAWCPIDQKVGIVKETMIGKYKYILVDLANCSSCFQAEDLELISSTIICDIET